jgi:lipoprotein-anchoring transpeptidase ErfK/SrfK
MGHNRIISCVVISAVVGVAMASSASADPLALTDPFYGRTTVFDSVIRDKAKTDDQDTIALPARLQRQVVEYSTREAPGTIIIDTPHTYLYLVLGNGKAIRYGIGVGRDGFTWSGIQSIARKTEWPDWNPPADMLRRQPYLPRFMAGGPGNPLGARAMYLGNTIYRIHGTNNPSTIGGHVSSGCIRMTNEDVTDLYDRVQLGAKVVVLPMTPHNEPATVRARTAPAPAAHALPGVRTSATTWPVRTSETQRPLGLY